MKIRFYDLFAGIGAFRLGMERAGFICVGSCEIDKYALQVYNTRFSEQNEPQDARKLDARKLPDFEVLTAGFPCQAFSYAGKRLGFNETRGTLFFEIVRIAKEKRPEILLLENVRGLLNHDRGRTFSTIIDKLSKVGYDLEWQCIDGKYFVPQKRERIFIIGYRRDKPRRKIFPIEGCCKNNDQTPEEAQRERERFRNEYSTAIDANYWKGGGSGSRTMILAAHTKANIKQRVQDREEVWTIDTSNSKQYITEGSRIRRLTPLECERVMGLPDGWTKVEGVSDTQRYKCIGNAVIPQVVEMIGKELMK